MLAFLGSRCRVSSFSLTTPPIHRGESATGSIGRDFGSTAAERGDCHELRKNITIST
jgi:hypothetical protein